MSQLTASDYLYRIGYTGPLQPSLPLLRNLISAHLSAVPFENLDMLRQVPFSLERADLWDKIVARRRGGVCHELNNSLRYLLEELGFTVALRTGRIDSPDDPLEHTLLLVELDGVQWITDVGCGKHSYPPLRLDSRDIQAGFGADYRLEDGADGTLTLLRRGRDEEAFSFFYALYPTPRKKEDVIDSFRAACVPGATPFSSWPMCARLSGDTRYSFFRHTLTIDRPGGVEHRTADDDAGALDLIRTFFLLDV